MLYAPPVWTRHVATLLVLPAFILVAAAYVKGTRIKARVGHPMILGVKLWAFAHLISNGTLADVVLFGSFLVWAVIDYIASRRRDRAAGIVYPVGPVVARLDRRWRGRARLAPLRVLPARAADRRATVRLSRPATL